MSEVIETSVDLDSILCKQYTLSMLLGCASSLLYDMHAGIKISEKKYTWFMKAIENVIYKNIPAPPMP